MRTRLLVPVAVAFVYLASAGLVSGVAASPAQTSPAEPYRAIEQVHWHDQSQSQPSTDWSFHDLEDAVTDVASPPVDFSPLAIAVGYSRYDDSDPLAHDTRQAIYDEVVATPGIYVAKLASETGTDVSTTRYHCRILEGEGLIEQRSIDGHNCLFPAKPAFRDDADDRSPEVQAALANDAKAGVLQAVYRSEPATVSAIATRLDRSPSTVSYHLDRLESADLVERQRDGRTAAVRLTPRVRTAFDGAMVDESVGD